MNFERLRIIGGETLKSAGYLAASSATLTAAYSCYSVRESGHEFDNNLGAFYYSLEQRSEPDNAENTEGIQTVADDLQHGSLENEIELSPRQELLLEKVDNSRNDYQRHQNILGISVLIVAAGVAGAGFSLYNERRMAED